MKVLFDHKLFYQVYGGASKYFVMMMNSLPKECFETTALFSCNEYARNKKLFRTFPKVFPGQASLLEHLNRPYTYLEARLKNYDVIHQTDFDNYFYSAMGDKPLVVTYHDANMSTYNPHPEMVSMQKIALARANAIVCVSENTKKDLLRLFDVDEKKVHVVYHGIEMSNRDNSSRIISEPYVLYVGFRAKYKNFDRFIQVFALYHEKYPDVKLVCTSYPFTRLEMEKFDKLHIAESVINISADEKTMDSLYHNALFFVYPSVYEGFGMPILEAWANECVVALSDASCFPEICSDAGAYFDPESIDGMLDTMLKLTEDEELRRIYVKRGKDRVKNFSWERCAKEHYKIYKSLL